MNREIRHSLLINAPIDVIMNALMREKHIQKWWTKEARVRDGKGKFNLRDGGN